MRNNISAKKWLLVQSKTNSKCAYCGIDLLSLDNFNSTIDHIIPKSKGGRENIDNLLPCCRTCNTSKGKKSIEQYRFWVTCKRNNIPTFSSGQLKYLSTKVDLDKVFPPLVSFYFETMNGGK